MKNILANIWTKRVFSIFSGFYAFGACFLCYCSLFYTVEITSKSALCVLLSGISLFFLVIMIYTRKQLITTLSSFVILPAMLPVILFYFGEWHLIIPIVAVGIIIFLMSGAGEALKTTLGTIFLLLYIFQILFLVLKYILLYLYIYHYYILNNIFHFSLNNVDFLNLCICHAS